MTSRHLCALCTFPARSYGALAVTDDSLNPKGDCTVLPSLTVVRSPSCSVYRTLRTVHVQDHPPVRRTDIARLHFAKSAQPSTLPSSRNRLMVLVIGDYAFPTIPASSGRTVRSLVSS